MPQNCCISAFLTEGIIKNLGSTIELTLYRIITELINNTIKHAQAQQVIIELKHEGNRIWLRYKTMGWVLSWTKQLEKGDHTLGLRNIISRVRSLKGDFSFRNTSPGIEVKIGLDSKN